MISLRNHSWDDPHHYWVIHNFHPTSLGDLDLSTDGSAFVEFQLTGTFTHISYYCGVKSKKNGQSGTLPTDNEPNGNNDENNRFGVLPIDYDIYGNNEKNPNETTESENPADSTSGGLDSSGSGLNSSESGLNSSGSGLDGGNQWWNGIDYKDGDFQLKGTTGPHYEGTSTINQSSSRMKNGDYDYFDVFIFSKYKIENNDGSPVSNAEVQLGQKALEKLREEANAVKNALIEIKGTMPDD